MPYLYSVVREGCRTGLPIMRALWLHHPKDIEATRRGDEFLWGRDILVSPVVEKGATSRRLYLPKGRWIDFWSEETLEGGREIDRAVDLETMPLHVRAGAIIPFGPVLQYVDEPNDTPLLLTVYPGANGAFEAYDDDGSTFAYRKGEMMRLTMRWTDLTRQLALSLAPGSKMLEPGEYPIDARIAGQTTRKRVLFSGKPAVLQL